MWPVQHHRAKRALPVAACVAVPDQEVCCWLLQVIVASKFDNRLKEFGERWEVDKYLSATGYLPANVKPFFIALPKVGSLHRLPAAASTRACVSLRQHSTVSSCRSLPCAAAELPPHRVMLCCAVLACAPCVCAGAQHPDQR